MIHPDSELRFINEKIGYGMVATRFIPAGTLLWVRDPLDRAFSRAEMMRLAPSVRALVETFGFIDEREDWILCWDGGRNMNHACDPSGRGYKQRFEIARKDIHPGEELSCEYGGLRITRTFPCFCGAENCRGEICPEDTACYEEGWLKEAEALIRTIPSVPQPLWPLAKTLVEDDEVILRMAGCPQLPLQPGTGPWSL